MQQYIARRLIQMVFVLLAFSVIVFTVLRLIPGDPVAVMLGTEIGEEGYKQLRHEMGLDRPIYVQYARWLNEVVHGNFGTSWRSQQAASYLIQRRFPATAWLTLAATFISLIISMPLGIISGIKPHSWISHFATAFSLAGIAMPSFWLGLMLMLMFAIWRKWLPPSGYVSPFEDVVLSFKHLIMPAVTLGVGLAAPLTRFMRSGMLDVLGTDYVRTARAKGLTDNAVIFKHVLKNALLSVITVFGLWVGAMLGGSMVTETVFNWPGLGTLLLQAIQTRDYGIVQGVVLFVCLVYMALNLLVDISYAFLDPRIRLDEAMD